MKRIFIIYAIVAVIIFAYIATILGLSILNDPNSTTFNFIKMTFITFGLPSMIFIWFPMRILCAYKRKSSNNNKQ